ncbi:MAG TPA: SpoIIE family protein phosphatase [Telluria sp.]|nr:SpoIIE family protein phosphatase [Telluria sp.]
MLRRLLLNSRAGRGRPLALVLTALLGMLLCVPGDGPLPALRLALFDSYQALMPRHRASGPAQVIGIDEAAIKQFGQWPWPRTRLAELVDRIAAGGALAIGLDIIMPDADMTSPEALAASLGLNQSGLRAELAALPVHDDVLAASIRRTRVVLGVAGFDVATAGTTDLVRAWPVLVKGVEVRAHLRHYPQALASLPSLQAAAKGQALLSADLEKGVVRRVPLVGSVGGALLPSFSIELLRVATGAPAVTVNADAYGARSVSVGDLTVPTRPDGTVWPYFSPPAPDRYISAFDLMTGKADPAALQDKIVIVALTGIGLMDNKTNARGDFLPGVDVHVQLIESFLDGRFLQRPRWMRWAEAGVFGASSLLLVWALPLLRLRLAALLGATLSLALFGGAAILFARTGLLFDAAGVFLAMSVVCAVLLATMFIAEVRDRKRSERALQLAREAGARAAGELSAARRIQMATLPVAASAFPGETRFALDALLEPAREVGGDLYDFFMLDRDRLFFLIGDVSGKGLPASLFMVVAKALSKSIALRGSADDVATIMKHANQELVRENPEMLFVTGVAGILDARSGEVALCNAGHDAPRLLTRDGRVEPLGAAGGPPLCVIDDFEYPVQRYQLREGDCLCLITDGITEAMNEAGALYTSARLDALLAGAGAGAPAAPRDVVRAVREDVRAYVGEAEPSDDLTLLVLCWKGAA